MGPNPRQAPALGFWLERGSYFFRVSRLRGLDLGRDVGALPRIQRLRRSPWMPSLTRRKTTKTIIDASGGDVPLLPHSVWNRYSIASDSVAGG
uniref:Uncharacterized protein n=1 Tax=Physcomitrium patens TaxID=3218 RepID=A0A2K1KE39_PHYPA|nr:hypothetical protein PHYPA_008414 [Physcomitrium patens]